MRPSDGVGGVGDGGGGRGGVAGVASRRRGEWRVVMDQEGGGDGDGLVFLGEHVPGSYLAKMRQAWGV